MDIKGKIKGIKKGLFLLDNNFSQEQIRFTEILLNEAVENGFVIKIGGIK